MHMPSALPSALRTHLPANNASTLRAALMCRHQRLCSSTSTTVLKAGSPRRSVRVLELRDAGVGMARHGQLRRHSMQATTGSAAPLHARPPTRGWTWRPRPPA